MAANGPPTKEPMAPGNNKLSNQELVANSSTAESQLSPMIESPLFNAMYQLKQLEIYLLESYFVMAYHSFLVLFPRVFAALFTEFIFYNIT